MSQTKKIGIYSGMFDPIHHGHIAFARKAATQLGLDKVYFLVDPKPVRGASDLRHRLAMTWLALQDYPELELLPSTEKQPLSLANTLPWLEEKFAQAELHFLMGADVFQKVHTWPGYESFKRRFKLAVGQPTTDSQPASTDHNVVPTDLHDISSSQLRQLPVSQLVGLVPELVAQYIQVHKPYAAEVSADPNDSSSSVAKSL